MDSIVFFPFENSEIKERGRKFGLSWSIWSNWLHNHRWMWHVEPPKKGRVIIEVLLLQSYFASDINYHKVCNLNYLFLFAIIKHRLFLIWYGQSFD